jgi:hypothetical protein
MKLLRQAAKKKLFDQEWYARLDSNQRPRAPEARALYN